MSCCDSRMSGEREGDLVADSGTDGAGSSAVHQSTRVAVVPVLVTKLLVGDGECAQLAVEDLPVLNREGGWTDDKMGILLA